MLLTGLPNSAGPEPGRRRLLLGLAGSTALAACGGGGGDGGLPTTGPTAPSAPVAGPAWWGFARDAQHSALGAVATQDLNRIAWRTPVDLAPPYRADGALLAHYGSPVISSNNTVVVPVKTALAGGFRIEARAGGNGVLLWQADSDYRLPPGSTWVPSWNPALDAANRLHAPAAGGRLLLRDNVDAVTGANRMAVFYGAAAYAAAPASYDASVYINTPLTLDAQGNAYFGFVVTGANPVGLVSGIARVAADGSGRWVGAATAAGDSLIAKLATNSAPALSADGSTLYVAVNVAPGGGVQRGVLLALDAATLATRGKVALVEPGSGLPARLSDNGTSSPTVGPDGDVYFGVLENVFGSHNGRGWLLHFDATLGTAKIPGGFGWDDTASIVPVAMLAAYGGPSAYLLMIKYNNYAGAGTGDGDNRLAVVDPNVPQADAISGLPIMREVLTLSGPTFESGNAGPVKEWCINTAAVDPLTRSVLVNSEDGWLYRWHLPSNSFTQRVQLTSGIAESYTPTAIGADGAVYAINNAVLFSIGR